MKKGLAILSLLFAFRVSHACEICVCGLGNYYIGMVPQFSHGFVGVRYQYIRFHTQIASDATQFSNDQFQTVEVWAGVNMGKRWQALVFLPYGFNKQVSDDGIKQNSGIGDVALLVNYSLLESSSMNKDESKLIFQQLWVGAGLKLPTGKANIDPAASDLVALANSQLGTGSTDVMLNVAYALHIAKWGLSTNANYKINTENKEAYRFGNRLSSNTFLFYSLKAAGITVTPNLGVLYEHLAANELSNSKVAQTGGHALSSGLGVELSKGSINLGMNVQNPLTQDYAMGQTKGKLRAMAHVTLSF